MWLDKKCMLVGFKFWEVELRVELRVAGGGIETTNRIASEGASG
jgi:hypothetical protein